MLLPNASQTRSSWIIRPICLQPDPAQFHCRERDFCASQIPEAAWELGDLPLHSFAPSSAVRFGSDKAAPYFLLLPSSVTHGSPHFQVNYSTYHQAVRACLRDLSSMDAPVPNGADGDHHTQGTLFTLTVFCSSEVPFSLGSLREMTEVARLAAERFKSAQSHGKLHECSNEGTPK